MYRKSNRTQSLLLIYWLWRISVVMWTGLESVKTLWSCGRSRHQARTPPSHCAAGTPLALGGTGVPCSWGGRRTPRHHQSPRRSKSHAACKYRTLKDSHQSTPPSALQSLASHTAWASTHCHTPERHKRELELNFLFDIYISAKTMPKKTKKI